MSFRYLLLIPLLFWFSARAIARPDQHYAVLIHEILADPEPSIGLPGSAFIELFNTGELPVNLRQWKIGNGKTAATIKEDYELEAGGLLIICPASAENDYFLFGKALGLTGFPTLSHDSGEIILTDASGAVIHAMHYDKSWFRNELKSAGGWSLEMIDEKNPCGGSSNWRASENPAGGSPGQPNSVAAENPDREGPDLLRSISPDSTHILLLFSEPLDSSAAASPENFRFSAGNELPAGAEPLSPFYDEVRLTLPSPMRRQEIYEVSAPGVADCAGNNISIHNSCQAGLPEPAHSSDLIFNEILFNPPPAGFDFVELYNRSHNPLDLEQIFLAGKDAAGAVKDPVRLCSSPWLIFPGEYAVFTEDPEWTMEQFIVQHPEKLFRMSNLPSMPDDAGTLLLLDKAGSPIDELSYDHHWHSPLLANEEGVSLERLSAEKPTGNAANWTSAAADAGFGTPTEKNSAFVADPPGIGNFSLDPKIFSPDNDGYQDFCFIKYRQQTGFVVNIWIYNINGRPVRQLANNISLNTAGDFRWDGLDDASNPLPMGRYVIIVDLFSITGEIKKYKMVATLAR